MITKSVSLWYILFCVHRAMLDQLNTKNKLNTNIDHKSVFDHEKLNQIHNDLNANLAHNDSNTALAHEHFLNFLGNNPSSFELFNFIRQKLPIVDPSYIMPTLEHLKKLNAIDYTDPRTQIQSISNTAKTLFRDQVLTENGKKQSIFDLYIQAGLLPSTLKDLPPQTPNHLTQSIGVRVQIPYTKSKYNPIQTVASAPEISISDLVSTHYPDADTNMETNSPKAIDQLKAKLQKQIQTQDSRELLQTNDTLVTDRPALQEQSDTEPTIRLPEILQLSASEQANINTFLQDYKPQILNHADQQRTEINQFLGQMKKALSQPTQLSQFKKEILTNPQQYSKLTKSDSKQALYYSKNEHHLIIAVANLLGTKYYRIDLPKHPDYTFIKGNLKFETSAKFGTPEYTEALYHSLVQESGQLQLIQSQLNPDNLMTIYHTAITSPIISMVSTHSGFWPYFKDPILQHYSSGDMIDERMTIKDLYLNNKTFDHQTGYTEHSQNLGKSKLYHTNRQSNWFFNKNFQVENIAIASSGTGDLRGVDILIPQELNTEACKQDLYEALLQLYREVFQSSKYSHGINIQQQPTIWKNYQEERKYEKNTYFGLVESNGRGGGITLEIPASMVKSRIAKVFAKHIPQG